MSSETLWGHYTRAYPNNTTDKMTELSFAKSFLSTLDSRPLKLQPDHVSDQRTLEITGPYTLPRMSTPFKKRTVGAKDDTETQQSSTINVILKSSRNPVLSLTLPGIDKGTTVLQLKERAAKELKMEGTEKIRALYKKKPAGDIKTINDLIGEEGIGGEVEVSIMVMGYKEETVLKGAEDTKMEDVSVPVAQGPSGEEVLKSEDFWDDLRGWLLQRVRDEATARQVLEKFRASLTGS